MVVLGVSVRVNVQAAANPTSAPQESSYPVPAVNQLPTSHDGGIAGEGHAVEALSGVEEGEEGARRQHLGCSRCGGPIGSEGN